MGAVLLHQPGRSQSAVGPRRRRDTRACDKNRETVAEASWPGVDIPLAAAVPSPALAHDDEGGETSTYEDDEPNRQGNPHERGHVETQRIDSGDPLHMLDQFLHIVSFLLSLRRSSCRECTEPLVVPATLGTLSLLVCSVRSSSPRIAIASPHRSFPAWSPFETSPGRCPGVRGDSRTNGGTEQKFMLRMPNRPPPVTIQPRHRAFDTRGSAPGAIRLLCVAPTE